MYLQLTPKLDPDVFSNTKKTKIFGQNYNSLLLLNVVFSSSEML